MTGNNEGLSLARLLMVLSSMSPLFILWAIKGWGIKGISELYFLSFCLFFITVPNLFLWFRVRLVKKRKDRREVTAGDCEDHRDHLLVYLFAMLLPFYSVNIDSIRDLAGHVAAITFIVFLFWHLNMHYMNIFWAMKGFRVYTLKPAAANNSISGRIPVVLITKRSHIVKGEKISAYRLSQTVFLEDE